MPEIHEVLQISFACNSSTVSHNDKPSDFYAESKRKKKKRRFSYCVGSVLISCKLRFACKRRRSTNCSRLSACRHLLPARESVSRWMTYRWWPRDWAAIPLLILIYGTSPLVYQITNVYLFSYQSHTQQVNCKRLLATCFGSKIETSSGIFKNITHVFVQ
jgi:hypothetical protein